MIKRLMEDLRVLIEGDEEVSPEERRKQRGRSLPDTGVTAKRVMIYRAVRGTTTQTFNPMDYVTQSLKFAKGHAAHNADVDEEPSQVIAATVDAAHVYEAGNPGELFYDGPVVKGRPVFKAKPSWGSQ